ncbi:MAG: flagellar hook-length control protein FliK [Lachnospiraceae bacterium]|nr:flagellar hook-length control protein FliK [Lachnospiraceae bacterium]
MTAQGITNGAGSAMNAVFSGFPAVGGSVKGTQDASFEQIMETSKSGNDAVSDTPTYNKGVKGSAAEPKAVKDRAKEFFTGDSKVKDATVTQTEESAEVSVEETEAVSALMVQVQQVICEALGITEEQLTEAMEALGLDKADLTDRDSLQQLFLHVNQAEPTEFLTNEELFLSFNELVQDVEQTVETAGFTVEQVQDILKAAEPEAELADNTEGPELVTEQPEMVKEQATEPEADELEQPLTEAAETKVSDTSSEAKTETGSDEAEGHTAQAKKDGDTITVSTETDAEVRNVFIDALANHAVGQTGEADLAAAAQVREIANQIMEQIKITIRPEQTNMELQLNPEHLGRVNLTITEKEGMMTAQFTTQTEVAKEAIESQMTALRESLQNQGIKVEAIEVTVSEFGFERDRQSEEHGNGEPEKRRKSGSFAVEDTEEAAPKMADYLNVTDSSVDYSA